MDISSSLILRLLLNCGLSVNIMLVTMVKIYLKLMNTPKYKLTKTFVYEGISSYKPLITQLKWIVIVVNTIIIITLCL